MEKNNTVYYTIDEEIIGDPSLKINNTKIEDLQNRAVDILFNITGIDKTKLSYFINQFGISAILERPSIIGVTLEQKDKLSIINQLLLLLGDI